MTINNNFVIKNIIETIPKKNDIITFYKIIKIQKSQNLGWWIYKLINNNFINNSFETYIKKIYKKVKENIQKSKRKYTNKQK